MSLITETRQLGETDIAEMMSVAQSRSTLMGLPYEDWYPAVFFKKIAPAYLAGQGGRRVIGSFSEGKLVTFVAMKLWDHYPYWTMFALKSAAGPFPLLRDGVRACLSFAVAHSLEAGAFRCYFLANADWIPKEGKSSFTPFQRYVPAFQDYYLNTEAIIPAGQKPRYEYLWHIMQQMTYPFDVAVRVFTLKEGLRDHYPQVAKNLFEPTPAARSFNSQGLSS